MKPILVGVVGPCAAGKTTLVQGLLLREFRAKVIAQEHSYVADMWKRLTNPNYLIYLDASYPVTMKRKNLNWNEKEYHIQKKRLRNAKQFADLYIETDNLTPAEVLEKVIGFLESM